MVIGVDVLATLELTALTALERMTGGRRGVGQLPAYSVMRRVYCSPQLPQSRGVWETHCISVLYRAESPL